LPAIKWRNAFISCHFNTSLKVSSTTCHHRTPILDLSQSFHSNRGFPARANCHLLRSQSMTHSLLERKRINRRCSCLPPSRLIDTIRRVSVLSLLPSHEANTLGFRHFLLIYYYPRFDEQMTVISRKRMIFGTAVICTYFLFTLVASMILGK
jgi:hypothetical protein